MNEQIKKLIEQATTKEEFYPAGCDGHPEYRYDFNKEKFAALIIMECLSVMIDERQHQIAEFHKSGSNSPQVFQGMTGSFYTVDRINKHFGVEK